MKRTLSIFLTIVISLSMFSCLGVASSASANAEPVSISYTPAFPIELVDGVDTYRESYESFDRYKTDKYSICNAGDILTVTYSDGSLKNYECSVPTKYDSDGFGVYFSDSEGNELPLANEFLNSFSDDQSYDNQWTVGNEYEVIAQYMGIEITIPVKTIENPIESISYTPSSIELIDDKDGYWSSEYVWIGDVPEIKEYYKYSFNISAGDTIIVNYTDGSSVYYVYDSYLEDFVAPDGRKISTYSVNGKVERALSIESNQSYENQWTTGNTYKFILCYMNKEAIVNATVITCEHEWVGAPGLIEVPPTCIESGWVGEYCTKCESTREVEVPATGHTSSDWIVENEATVYKAGEKVKKCTECGEILKTAPVAQLKCSKTILKEVTNSQYGVKITWGKVKGGDTYNIYRRTKNGSYRKIGTTENTYFTDKTAVSGKRYYYSVKAVNEAGESAYSSAKSIYHLATPKLTKISNATGGLKLTWSKVSGAEGYYVYRKLYGADSWTRVATIKSGSTVSYKDTKVSKGKVYVYSVKAYDGSRKSSINSTGIWLRYLAVPTLKSATSTTTGIKLTWCKVTGAEGYYVYRKTGSGSWTRIATVVGNAKVTYLDKTAKKGTTYKYTVRAYKGETFSYYNTKGLTVKDKY